MTLTQLFTSIANAIRTKKGTSDSIYAENFPNEISEIVELKGETKTVTPTTSQQIITPSSGKNGITQATVNAVTSAIDNNIVAENIKKDVTILNVTGTFEGGASEYNAKIITTPIVNQYSAIVGFIQETPAVDISRLQTTSLSYMFNNAYNLETVALFDTSRATDFSRMFYNCGKLINVPEFNTSNVTNLQYCFTGCNSLSNESLNNILAMCYKSAATNGKNLMQIGLTSAQADICETLPNWNAYIAGGWFKGY